MARCTGYKDIMFIGYSGVYKVASTDKHDYSDRIPVVPTRTPGSNSSSTEPDCWDYKVEVSHGANGEYARGESLPGSVGFLMTWLDTNNSDEYRG